MTLFRLVGCAIVLAIAVAASAQDGPPRSAPLPPAFAAFSAADVLALVFDGYDRATGRVASMRNEDGKPALVAVMEAKVWQPGGQEHLVVTIQLGATDYQVRESLCGNCRALAVMAVLKNDRGTLTLVARQKPPKFANGEDEEPTPYEPLSYSGHGGWSLDLAPYALSAKEMLIGARSAHMWLPAQIHTEWLVLHRIEGQWLRPVFSVTVADHTYPQWDGPDSGPQPLVKMTATVVPVTSTRPFYDLRINRTTVRCADRNEDDTCSAEDGALRRVSSATEVWRFNGEEYVLAPRRQK